MSEELEAYKKALKRERESRKAAEKILEDKSMQLFMKNKELEELNRNLEQQVKDRTRVLEESEAKYRDLIESANDIIYGADQNGYFEFVNAVAERILGYPSEAYIGRHFSEFVLESHQEAAAEFYANQFRNLEPQSYYEFPMRASNGNIIWVGQNVRARFNDDNRIIGYLAVARDITAQRRAERQLRQSEEKYRSIIENLQFGMMEVDVEGRVTRMYDGMSRMTGYTEEELLGKHPAEILLPKQWREYMAEQQRRRKEGESHVYEVQVKKKDGSLVWAMISGTPLYDEQGRVSGSIGVHLDLSDRKRIEDELREAQQRAEESARTKEQFLANMSHEIRTPMNGIKGMMQLLNRTQLDPDQQRYMRNMMDSSDHLMVLINDILDLSKIEAGKLSLETVPVALAHLLEHVESVFNQRAAVKGIALDTWLDPRIDFNVLTDPTRVRQVLDNLVNNAIKFTETGGVSVSISLLHAHDNQHALRFSVKDTGVGIELKRIHDVFETFTQESDSTTRMYGGTGLGLPICKQLVELMGGEIGIRSVKHVGTEVTFNLTLEGTTETPPTQRALHLDSFGGLKGVRVLLAEDHDINRFLAAKLLQDAGVIVIHAENGQEAIDQLGTHQVDLVLMDMQMPVLDGLDATRHIRNELKSEVPIVALTANAIQGDRQRCLDAGMNDYLAKPFEPAELLGKMADLLGIATEEVTAEPAPEEPVEPELAMYDLGSLRELAGGDDGFFNRMLNMFIERTPVSLAEMREAASNGNPERASKLAHQLKPSVDSLRMRDVKSLVRAVEAAGKDGAGAAELLPMVEALEQALNPIIEALKGELI